MKNKSNHTSLDDLISEQLEGIKVLYILFEQIHKTTKNPNIKAFSHLGKKFCKELRTDCESLGMIVYEMKKAELILTK